MSLQIERSYFWNPQNGEPKYIPKVLFSYHVIDYLDIEEIEDFLKREGLIEVSNPIYTNCKLSWLTLYLDIKRYGFNPLEMNYSRLIRDGNGF